MRVIISGSRDLVDIDLITKSIQEAAKDWDITEVITGGSAGVDTIVNMLATQNGIPVKQFIPQWNQPMDLPDGTKQPMGRRAGPERHRQMADAADAALIIWKNQSDGTQNLINALVPKAIPMIIVDAETGQATRFNMGKAA